MKPAWLRVISMAALGAFLPLATLLALAVAAQAEDTFAVGGTVVNRVTGAPLNKANVYLADRMVTTGTDGRFRFEGVKPGKYPLQAQRLGFTRQAYRQRAIGTPYSSAIVVGENQKSEGLVFGLLPAAVITGTVRAPNGDPIAGVNVYGMRLLGPGADRRGPANSAVTDDRGIYRLTSISEGNYVLIFAGGDADPPATVTESAWVPAFYPPAATGAKGASLKVQAGKETRADITLEAAPVLKLFCTADPTDASTADTPGAVSTPNSPAGRARALGQQPDRHVTITLPGPYGGEFLIVQNTPLYGGQRSQCGAVPSGRYLARLWDTQNKLLAAHTFDAVAETDIRFSNASFARVKAKVTFNGTPKNPNASPFLMLADVAESRIFPVLIGADGTADIPSVPPGDYEVTVNRGGLVPLISLSAAGAKVVGSTVQVPETGIITATIVAEVTVAASVHGTVLRGDAAQAGLLVILAPANLSNMMLYRVDQSDSDGTFTWASVPAGDYLAFTFENGEAGDYLDPELMRKLVSKGQKVTVTNDANQTVRISLTD